VLGTDRDAADGSKPTASSLRLSDSGPLAVSRKPMADADRGIEHYAFLQSLMNGTRVYPRLVKHFRDADDRYNSGLFHFRAGRRDMTEMFRHFGSCPKPGTCRPPRPTRA